MEERGDQHWLQYSTSKYFRWFLGVKSSFIWKINVQCGDLVEKAQESQRKLAQMETECHEVVVEENPKVRSVDIFLKSEPTGVEEITSVQMDAFHSLRWESLHSKGSIVNAWEYLILYAKFMEFLPNKRKKKGDIFFLSFWPP